MVRLIRFEIKKCFIKWPILIAVIALSIINVVKIGSIYNENSWISKHSSPKWNEVYWQLYEEYSGKITTEKIEKLLSVYRPLEQKTADLTASTRMDDPETYTGNVYSDYNLFSDYYVKPMKYAYMYAQSASVIAAKAQDNMAFFKSKGNDYLYKENQAIAALYAGREVSDFSYTEMYQYYLKYDFSSLLVLLICLYGLVGVFVSEKETDMDTLLLTTPHGGRKTVVAKIIASVLFILTICLWFWLLDFTAFTVSFQSLEAASSPIYALKNFENASVNISLVGYSFLSAVVKSIGMTVIGLMFLWISLVSQNARLPFITNLGLAGIGILYQEITAGSGHIFAKALNPFVLLSNSELFSKTEFANVFGIPIPSYAVAVSSAVMLSGVVVCIILFFAKTNALAKRKKV